VEVVRRDTKEKMSLPLADIVATVDQLLVDIQTNIYSKARSFRDSHTTRVDSYDEFKRMLDEEPGFLLAHYDGTSETEERIKDETKATVRCLALAEPDEEGVCMVTGKPSPRRAYFARAY
jgi:prolyl-tRNA synthetase